MEKNYKVLESIQNEVKEQLINAFKIGYEQGYRDGESHATNIVTNIYVKTKDRQIKPTIVDKESDFQVGDVVKCINNFQMEDYIFMNSLYIVVNENAICGYMTIMNKNGYTYTVKTNNFKKTDINLPIKGILEYLVTVNKID